VDRETCETGGVMEGKLAADGGEGQPTPFPYSSWGVQMAIGGVLLALGVGILLGIPAIVIDRPVNGNLSDAANAGVQLATAVGFLLVPIAVASRWGESSVGQALRRLGVRSFRPSALKWMAAAVGAYLLFAAVYTAVFGSPHQKDIAESFGAVPVQVALIVVAAPISEEVCFRGMLFGGLRTRMPRLAAALLSALIFGGLHALTGLSAVPPLIAFGFVLALLYEKTGSIVPGILLHMLNNSVALLGQ
jgi:CAAX protease family protein